ncbi:TIM barrel protein [Amnibacterium sp. CER49]|uniref:TIM barrel protein n=1 Tax=Amnibacterium sp. CER49 TaxID=3039161 RepID=UPI002449430E|nr:TIM barrel protein [Amnibacterium sp. CER49]MDH2444888.1 TIM barrel protein [Amnibacterium sp. CER49]
MTIDIAGAPVSFGVFELTDPAAMASLPGPDRVCEVLAGAGYTGIDLGPVGFLGTGAELEERLRRFGLGLAGGWIDLPFSDDERFAAALPLLDVALAAFAAGAAAPSPRPPKPTLADSGDASRKASPGGGAGLSLTGERLERFAGNVRTAAARIRAAGFEPTFHHHVGTYVETPDEIDAFLAATDVDLTFDTGHLLLGGGDALAGWRRWASRINHLHLKDVDLSVLQAVQARHGDMVDVWASRAFVPVGDGDLDVGAIVDAVLADGFDGWLVIEQDVLPSASIRVATLEQDQVLNLQRLSALLAR